MLDQDDIHPLFAGAPDTTEFRKLRKRIVRETRDAIETYGMARPGDRWLVCLSGGKDSYTLLAALTELRWRGLLPVDLLACNLDQGQPGSKASSAAGAGMSWSRAAGRQPLNFASNAAQIAAAGLTFAEAPAASVARAMPLEPPSPPAATPDRTFARVTGLVAGIGLAVILATHVVLDRAASRQALSAERAMVAASEVAAARAVVVALDRLAALPAGRRGPDRAHPARLGHRAPGGAGRPPPRADAGARRGGGAARGRRRHRAALRGSHARRPTRSPPCRPSSRAGCCRSST